MAGSSRNGGHGKNSRPKGRGAPVGPRTFRLKSPVETVGVWAVEMDPSVGISEDTKIAVMIANVRMHEGEKPINISIPLTSTALARLGAQVSRALLTQVLFAAAIYRQESDVGNRATVTPVREPENEEVVDD